MSELEQMIQQKVDDHITDFLFYIEEIGLKKAKREILKSTYLKEVIEYVNGYGKA